MTVAVQWRERERYSFTLSYTVLQADILVFCVSEEKCRSFIELSPPAERGKSKSPYLTVAIQCTSLGQGTCNISPAWGQWGGSPNTQASWMLKIERFPPRCLPKLLSSVRSATETPGLLPHEVGFVFFSKSSSSSLSSHVVNREGMDITQGHSFPCAGCSLSAAVLSSDGCLWEPSHFLVLSNQDIQKAHFEWNPASSNIKSGLESWLFLSHGSNFPGDNVSKPGWAGTHTGQLQQPEGKWVF